MTKTRNRPTRKELTRLLVERDGTSCKHPDCGEEIDFTQTGRMAPTIDHWRPQFKCIEEGWSYEETWDLSNLVLMHKRCNAAKGDLIPNEDGTLPEKPISKFRYRREKRAKRPEICDSCNAGRNLQEDEWCNACGSGPQPARYPKWRQMKLSDCDHDLFFCVGCTVYDPSMRRSVLDTLLYGGEGYE